MRVNCGKSQINYTLFKKIFIMVDVFIKKQPNFIVQDIFNLDGVEELYQNLLHRIKLNTIVCRF